MAPPSVAGTNLNAVAHLQTFPYPMMPKSFPNSKVLMAKWRSQSLSFKSVTDQQTQRKLANLSSDPSRHITGSMRIPRHCFGGKGKGQRRKEGKGVGWEMGKNREGNVMEMGAKGREEWEMREGKQGMRRREWGEEDGKGQKKKRQGKEKNEKEREGKGEGKWCKVVWRILYPPHPQSGPNLAFTCGPMVYSSMPNFIVIGICYFI